MNDNLAGFLEVLGGAEEPIGMFYTDTEPDAGFAPKEGVPVSRELEQRNEIDWSATWKTFSCVMGNIWLARRKNTAAYFEARRYGCVGGSFYLGFHRPQLEFIAHYAFSRRSTRDRPLPDSVFSSR